MFVGGSEGTAVPCGAPWRMRPTSAEGCKIILWRIQQHERKLSMQTCLRKPWSSRQNLYEPSRLWTVRLLSVDRWSSTGDASQCTSDHLDWWSQMFLLISNDDWHSWWMMPPAWRLMEVLTPPGSCSWCDEARWDLSHQIEWGRKWKKEEGRGRNMEEEEQRWRKE